MEPAGLDGLPDHLLLDVMEQLDTARDISRFGSSSRRTHDLVQHDGWKSFVRNRFPSLTVPSDGSTRWSAVADRLTYLDRCWDKRGFLFLFFQEEGHGRGRNRWPRRGQSVTFQGVVGAHLLPSLRDEILACGAGEDLLVRWRATGDGQRSETWRSLAGRESGYAAGAGDVTALALLDGDSRPEMLVGRANGEVQLLSAADDESFGRPAKQLLPADQDESGGRQRSPGRLAVTWAEWHAETRMAASCRSSLLTLHNLAPSEETELKPVACYDASRAGAEGGAAPLVRCAKFMGADGIACGIGGSHEPLRWGKIRPTGVDLVSATRSGEALAYSESPTEKQTVRAMEPVGGPANPNLLLSAWDDGTYRLLDVRTPSDRDAVYRDRFQPYHAGSSLLVYGMERFVAGANSEPVLRLFDFRQPKPYYHFNASPCSDSPPSPAPPEVAQRRAKGAPEPGEGSGGAACDAGRRIVCRWHAKSRDPGWRPDATLYLGADVYDRIFSLAKASDTSEAFYCGVRGAVVEARPTLAQDIGRGGTPRPAPAGWTVRGNERDTARVGLLETGVGRCRADGGPLGVDLMTTADMYRYRPWHPLSTFSGGAPDVGRLDSRWQGR
ncbi:hypothetical protein CDD83_3201 [Cordyceps sp. RAO-2017]|nr:hypothetical protein CDD83_3201 [Cordyceps sp. RAO-2017]